MTGTLGRRADINLAAFDRVAWRGEDVVIAGDGSDRLMTEAEQRD